MIRSSHIAALLSAFALVAPSAALAQGSAADNTYTDPFSSQNGGNHGGSAGNGGNSSGTRGSSSTGNSSSSSTGSGSSPTATTASAPTGAATGTSSASGSSTGKLPRTGLDAAIIAFAGALLIASGVALRRRIPAFWR